MRPAGEIREALRTAFAERGACTWRDVAPLVPGVDAACRADLALVRRTVVNMVSAGELVPAGYAKVAGSARWHAIYEPQEQTTPQPWGGIEALADVVRGWQMP